MSVNRRQWLQASGCGLAATLSPALFAQTTYPQRPITMVVPFTAGGGGDLVARLIGKHLGEKLSTSVVVDNKPGAGGTIGSAFALRSPADGYTLLNLSSSFAMQSSVTRVPFDPLRDIQPIIVLVRDPGVVLVGPKSPLRTGKDLFEAARRDPGKITYGSAGVGTIAHLGVESLAYQMGVQMQHIPYKGSSQAFNDLLAGSIDLMLTTSTYAANFVKTGRAHAVGICGSERTELMPQVPTFAEQGWPGYVLYDWKAIAGPAGMPQEVVQLLNKSINEVLQLESVREKFKADGVSIVGGSPDVLAKTLREDLDTWKTLVKKANLKVE